MVLLAASSCWALYAGPAAAQGAPSADSQAVQQALNDAREALEDARRAREEAQQAREAAQKLLAQSQNSGQAVAPAAKVPSWFELIKINAFLEAGYVWNFNRPDSDLNQLRVFDMDHNSIAVNGEVVVQREATKPGDFGFRFDLAAGSSIPKVSAARGLFRDPATGKAGDFDLQQAYGSYIVPLGKGLRIDAGKFVTIAGAELIEGYDGFNDNYSRSLLFGYAIPFTHTGFRVGYTFNDYFAAALLLTNGWDNVIDNNGGKSAGAQLTITPHKRFSLFVNYLVGPEQDRNSTNVRHLVDVVAVWKAHDLFTLTLNGDYAFDANALPSGDAQWYGLALGLRYQVHRIFALCARTEWFSDPNGVRTGTAQDVYEVTLTPELRVADGFVLRAEGRVDISNQNVFDKAGSPASTKVQPTVALNALFFY
jgi:Putative beta-barrel porin-2, OmpL-like. bbp2